MLFLKHFGPWFGPFFQTRTFFNLFISPCLRQNNNKNKRFAYYIATQWSNNATFLHHLRCLTKFCVIRELLTYDLSVSIMNCNTKTMEGFRNELP